MSVGEIVLLIVGFVEFIIILVVCSKGTDIESEPGMLYQVPSHDYEKDMLRNDNYTLHKKLRDMEYRLRYDRPWGLTATEINAMRTLAERPVEVNIENIIKVSTNE